MNTEALDKIRRHARQRIPLTQGEATALEAALYQAEHKIESLREALAAGGFICSRCKRQSCPDSETPCKPVETPEPGDAEAKTGNVSPGLGFEQDSAKSRRLPVCSVEGVARGESRS